jgi:hypothetical protein
MNVNPELIRHARKHRYFMLEGFCTDKTIDLPDDMDKVLNEVAAELAKAANVTVEQACSAYASWLIQKEWERLSY